MNTVEITIGDNIFKGWRRVTVSVSMESMTGTFSASLVQSTKEIVGLIKTGMPVTISVTDGQRSAQIMEGWIETKKSQDSDNGISIDLGGRGKTCDIVDCSAIVPSMSWSAAPFVQVCKDVVKPFGIELIDYTSNTENIENFAIQSGDTAHTVIDNLCRSRGVVPIEDRWGNLTLIVSSGQVTTESDIEKGVNAVDITEDEDTTNRFSQYIVKGENGGGGEGWANDAGKLQGKATDSTIIRYRPIVLSAEGKATAKSVQTRAAWEAQVRAGRSKNYTAKVKSWIQSPAESSSYLPWALNEITRIVDSDLGIDTTQLITGLEFEYGDNGEAVTITTKHPDTYKPNPSGAVSE